MPVVSGFCAKSAFRFATTFYWDIKTLFGLITAQNASIKYNLAKFGTDSNRAERYFCVTVESVRMNFNGNINLRHLLLVLLRVALWWVNSACGGQSVAGTHTHMQYSCLHFHFFCAQATYIYMRYVIFVPSEQFSMLMLHVAQALSAELVTSSINVVWMFGSNFTQDNTRLTQFFNPMNSTLSQMFMEYNCQ